MTITFDSCSTGLVEFEFTDSDLIGSIPITRIANDNVEWCEN